MFIKVQLANEAAGHAIVNTEHIAFVGMAPDGSTQISLSNGVTFPVLHTLPTMEHLLGVGDG
jgi:hypothetical protein